TALREQRKQTGDPWNRGPIVKRKYSGEGAPDAITLRQANEDIGYTRRGEHTAEQLAQAKEMFGPHFKPRHDALKATINDAHRYEDGIKSPPRKIGLKDIDGREVPPLDDRVPLRASDALPNARAAALLQGNWRTAREQEAAQFAQALDQAKAD